MELHNKRIQKDSVIIFHPAPRIVVPSYALLLVLLIWNSSGKSSKVFAEPLSPENAANPSKSPVFIDLFRWENRSAYPRFILYRDYFRRQAIPISSSIKDSFFPVEYAKPENIGSAIISTKSLKTSLDLTSEPQSAPANENTEEVFDDEYDIASLEKLLSERNGIIVQATTMPSSSKLSLSKDVVTAPPHKRPITFPKDKTNPFNRLQINPEETTPSQSGEKLNKEVEREVDYSFEVGNRENFESRNASCEDAQDEEDVLELIRDAVPTFDLTMNIIKLNDWQEENILFSPFSIANVLSMIMLGADGKTFTVEYTFLQIKL